VTFENGNGDPISGVAPQAIDENGEVDLSTLGLQHHPRFVQFSISLPGAQHQPITMSLEWTAVTVSAMYSLLIQGLGPSRCGDGQKNIRLPQRLWAFAYNSL
jgi:hypothetical protein